MLYDFLFCTFVLIFVLLMKDFFSNLKYFRQLLLRLGVVLVLFSMIRLLFYLINMDAFPAISTGELIKLFGAGIRFDVAAIVYVNSLFILLSLFPFKIREHPSFQRIQLWVFMLFNCLAVLFEMIDIGFYPFANRRTIGSDLNIFRNTAEMIPGYLAEYWPLLICLCFFFGLLFYFYKKIRLPGALKKTPFSTQLIIFLMGCSIFIILARGGFQLRPLMPISALEYVEDNRLAALVSNTNLSLIFSTQQQFLKKKNYFDPTEQKRIFNTQRQYHQDTKLRTKNIFIIVLESFGEEHISYFHPKLNTTPFLDSLIERSFHLEASYANGLRSTQGIVAITTGIPSLMQAPLMFSAYQSNRIDGLAKLLAEKGYTTSFFHGANPGSMEFERFAKLSGFQHYYDRRHFDNDAEYDGQWGIWDEPFFQYTAQTVNQQKAPFLALVFSLTSHHPYKTPAWFEKQHKEMSALHRSVRYTDYALKRFFETARQMPWYDETLFVITADHTGLSDEALYQTRNGKYKVPILIFDPAQEIVGKQPGIAQQIDIQATLLDYLQYDDPFKSYGTSMLDSLRHNWMINLDNDVYQVLDQQSLLLFDGKKVVDHFDYQGDPFLQKTQNPNTRPDLEQRLKAIIQQYHREMVDNVLYLETEE